MTDTPPADERLMILTPIPGRLGRDLKISVADQAVIMAEGPVDGSPPIVAWDGFLRDEILVLVEGPAGLVAATLRHLADLAEEALERRERERAEMPDGPGSLIESMIGPRP